MGIRSDSPIALLALGVILAVFGVWRLMSEGRTGWLLIGAGILAVAGAWWRIGHPGHPPED